MVIEDLIFYSAMLFGMLLVLIPLVLIVYGIFKRHRKIVITCIIIMVLVCLSLYGILSSFWDLYGFIMIGAFFIGGYYLLFPTHYPYMDLWIMGKTEAEIVEKYGEPYIGYDSYDHTIGYRTGSTAMFGEPYYYYIYFNENGRAIDCDISIFIKGG